MSINSRYINVILPLPLASTFTYSIPDEWVGKVRIGMRVVVPFGTKKMYTAIVESFRTHAPEEYEAKEIICFLDDKPILRHPQLKFWEWIQHYYKAYPGDVYQAAVPSGLKIQSETQVCINPEFEAEEPLNDREGKILDALSEGKPMTVAELSKLIESRVTMAILKQLLDKNAIEVSEELNDKFRPKKERFVKLGDELADEGRLAAVFDELGRAQKQLDLLMIYLDLSKWLQPNRRKEVSKKDLLSKKEDSSQSAFNSLVDRGVFQVYNKVVGRLDLSTLETTKAFPLNEFQLEAYKQINHLFLEKPVVLLHGITSSGKTEVYIHLIQKCLDEGNQALFLVPEIALTTQLTTRLKRIFGNRLGVYHSKFSDAERVEVWNHLLNDSAYDVVIGVRSSIFLPFRKLGLVIVDEEHETSYKQYDPAPRYHARNAAIVLASMHGAKTLLGTATPSIESYYNAASNKYGLVEINQRYESLALPEIIVVDVKEARRRKEMQSHFSDVLLEKIAKALQNKEQVILFQNRRGYAPYIECKACSYVPKCKNCDVSLTVHNYLNTLTCHYCGYTIPIPTVCPACKTPGTLSTKGFGTEKIEDEVKILFPQAKVSRMDLDTTRSKKSYEKIISDFEQHKVDILVGTQMISKGLDFEHVSLVGMLNADTMLNFPDFRASERAYQMLAQVSGRAGRKNKRGTVIVQTMQPGHPIIEQVIQANYKAMYATQCTEREIFHYPPYYKLVQIAVRHRDAETAKQASQQLGNMMRSVFGDRVLGPNDPLVPRIQNVYIKHLLLKVENEASFERAKDILEELKANLMSDSRFKSVRVNLDVDPM